MNSWSEFEHTGAFKYNNNKKLLKYSTKTFYIFLMNPKIMLGSMAVYDYRTRKIKS